MQTRLHLHFLKFDIQSRTLDLASWLENLYAANDLTREFPAQSATLTLQIEEKTSPHALDISRPRDAVFAETNLCTGRCYYGDGTFYSANDGDFWHEMEFKPAQNLVRANIGGHFLHSGQFVASNFLRPLLQSFILPFYNLKTLHGAVVARGERTIFLAGHGGMGKSTTTLQLIESGWDVLSDDGPFFFLQNGHARVLSSLDYLHVTENTLQLFPDFRAHVVGEIDSRQKFALRRQNLQNGETWKTPRQITDFIELKRGDFANPQLKNGERGEIFRTLFHESMIVFRRTELDENQLSARDYSQFIFQLVTSLLQNARVHRLEYANHHLKQIPALLNEL